MLYCDRINFLDFECESLTISSYNNHSLIAAASLEGSIYIINSNNLYILSYFPSSLLKSVSSMVWIGERLFSAGLDGFVKELCLKTNTIKHQVHVSDCHPITCLSASYDTIIAGNERGVIELFHIDELDNPPQMKSILNLTNGRIMCSAICAVKSYISAFGSDDGSVFIVDLLKCQLTNSFSIEAESKEDKVTIWDLIFAGKTLFSADSRGYVSLWNVKNGVIISTYECSSLGILCLTQSSDSSIVYAGGIESVIYSIVKSSEEETWSQGPLIKGCTNDIYSMVLIPPISTMLFDTDAYRSSSARILCFGPSARIEIVAATLTRASTAKLSGKKPYLMSPLDVGLIIDHSMVKHFMSTLSYLPYKLPGCFSTLAISSAQFEGDTLVLYFSSSKLELYRLGKISPGFVNEKHLYASLDSRLLKLADISPKSPQKILEAAFSPCGKYIAYSTEDNLTRILSTSDHKKVYVKIQRLNWSNNNDLFFTSALHSRKRSLSLSSGPQSGVSSCDESHEPETESSKRLEKKIRKRTTSNTSSSYGTSDEDREGDHQGVVDNQQDPIQDPMQMFIDPQISIMTRGFTSKSSLLPMQYEGAILSTSKCLAFSTDSQRLFIVPREDPTSIYCLNIHTAQIDYKTNLTPAFRINRLISQEIFIGSLKFQILMVLTASGRVFMVDSRQGDIIHKFPRALSMFATKSGSSTDSSWFPNIPVSVALNQTSGSPLQISILTASGQLREWSLKLGSDDTREKLEILSCDSCEWLTKFWTLNSRKIETTFWGMHSVIYLDRDTWLISSHKFFMRIKRNSTMPTDLNVDACNDCVKIINQNGNVVEILRLSQDRIAAVHLDPSKIILSNKPSYFAKHFGT